MSGTRVSEYKKVSSFVSSQSNGSREQIIREICRQKHRDTEKFREIKLKRWSLEREVVTNSRRLQLQREKVQIIDIEKDRRRTDTIF